MGRPLKSEPGVIVDTAVDLFWRQGYSGTTPMEMVKELGIGSRFRSFESKHNLFSLALRRNSADRKSLLACLLVGWRLRLISSTASIQHSRSP